MTNSIETTNKTSSLDTRMKEGDSGRAQDIERRMAKRVDRVDTMVAMVLIIQITLDLLLFRVWAAVSIPREIGGEQGWYSEIYQLCLQ